MPTKKLRRQHAATGLCEKRFVQRGPDTVDRLAFKYMMCKVDSSSDSESEASPRWSDASSKSFRGRTGPKRSSLPQKSFARHCQHPLDPYDGSSEDSAASADATKRQKHGGLRTKGRSRKVASNFPPLHKEVTRVGPRDFVAVLHHTDVQMRSSSDSELKTVSQRDPCPCRAIKHVNAELSENSKSSVLSTATPFGIETFQLTDGLLKNPIDPGILSKRKLFSPLGDTDESTHRKKQCISEMETESFFPEG
ncbi:uncharacterized protein LOC143480455 isoform X2 [Brachyhypopomus gauderio]|uniref:uncharacterized protein LOC143480455 isoform X2 n=1 Tax=Brachyhypopomus gauderio TaxID=698409 RepID=UPI004041ADB4